MGQETSFGLKVFIVLALACCQPVLAAVRVPPTVVCEAEGRLPDPTDCSYYMDCTSNGDGTYAHTITPCPVGSYYDPCQGDCSRTEPTDDCSISCDSVGQVIVSTENPSISFVCIQNSSRWYIHVDMCSNGNAVGDSFSCNGGPSGCSINNSNQSPGNSTCTGTYYYGDEQNCSVYYYCSGDGATPDPGFCATDEYFISYNHTCTEFVCTSEGFFADPANCSRFYSCIGEASGYVKQSHMCPTGYHFDSSVGVCAEGVCTTVCPGSRRNFTCTSTGFFADPLDCTSYYYCNSTLHATQYHCPEGSHFDSSVGGCMMGECSNTGTGFTCTSTGFFADPLNCTSYYYCNSSLYPTQYHCPEGSYFDSSVGGCMMGNCSNTGTGFTCTSTGFFADPLNCTSYYYCNDTLYPTQYNCPEGSHFDSSVGGCMMGNCSKTGTGFTCSSSGFFADPFNCSSYYYCNSTLYPTQYYCPRRSHFDSSIGGCMMGNCTDKLISTVL